MQGQLEEKEAELEFIILEKEGVEEELAAARANPAPLKVSEVQPQGDEQDLYVDLHPLFMASLSIKTQTTHTHSLSHKHTHIHTHATYTQHIHALQRRCLPTACELLPRVL